MLSNLDKIAPEHLEGVDAVVHCAAYAEEYGTRDQFFGPGMCSAPSSRLPVNAQKARFEQGYAAFVSVDQGLAEMSSAAT